MKARSVQGTVLMLASSVLLLSAAYTRCDAQRAAPSLVGYGQRAGEDGERGTIVAAGMVAWDYWGIMLPTCERGGGDTECAINVANGSDSTHALCLIAPKLRGPADTPAIPMSVRKIEKPNPGTAVTSRSDDQVCASVGPHDGITIVLASRGDAVAGIGRITVMLQERLGQRPDSTLRAPADIPIGSVRDTRSHPSRP